MSHEALYIPNEGVFPLLRPLIGFQEEMLSRLELHPYQRNVFLMLRFRTANAELSDFIISTLATHGLKGVRADDPEWSITKNAYNQIAVLYCCKYGIALFDEAEVGQTFNPNVCYEVGVLQSQGKDCLILKHRSLPQVPFDLIKDLHQEYEEEEQVRQAIRRWVEEISAAGKPEPGAGPRILTVEEEGLVLGASGLARLAAQGLRDAAPRLGGIDLAAFFAGAEEAAAIGFPLFLAGMQPALGELRDFVLLREGILNVVFLDPEAPFLQELLLSHGQDYAAAFDEMARRIRSLANERSKGTVRIYLQRFASGYSLFRADDRMIVAPWNDGLTQEESPCLILGRREGSPGMFGLYLDAFERTIRQRRARLIWTNRVY